MKKKSVKLTFFSTKEVCVPFGLQPVGGYYANQVDRSRSKFTEPIFAKFKLVYFRQ